LLYSMHSHYKQHLQRTEAHCIKLKCLVIDIEEDMKKSWNSNTSK